MSGKVGDNVFRASGLVKAAAAGRTGTVDWVTTVKTSSFTAVTAKGYFCNTTSGTITVSLPAGVAGSIISVADYARTWDSNAVTVTADGSEKIGGIAGSATLSTEGQSVTFVYIDGTEGWVNVQDSTSAVAASTYIVATGGTPCAGAECGDYKIHTFTGPGTLCIASLSCGPANNVVDYMVVAGGGGGGGYLGGGGAGGYRESVPSPAAWTGSPLANPGNARPVSVQGYPITIGAAGAAGGPPAGTQGGDGGTSTFSDITSAGGGGGAGNSAPTRPGRDGGSGGGASRAPGCATDGTAGAGNVPPVSPPQGSAGNTGYSDQATFTTGGAGGGATAAGAVGSPTTGGAGGTGAGNLFNPSTCYGTPGPSAPLRYFAGGGGGGTDNPSKGAGCGGAGGGGDGGLPPGATDGTTNTGGGGGSKATTGMAGGSGIVMVKYKFQ